LLKKAEDMDAKSAAADNRRAESELKSAELELKAAEKKAKKLAADYDIEVMARSVYESFKLGMSDVAIEEDAIDQPPLKSWVDFKACDIKLAYDWYVKRDAVSKTGHPTKKADMLAILSTVFTGRYQEEATEAAQATSY
jgi:hypothetical protein